MPALQRTAVVCLAPVVAIIFWLIGTRRMLSRYANTDDLPDQIDSQLREQASELADLIVDRRDGLLVLALDAIIDQHSAEPITVAVVYGSWARPPVVHHWAMLRGYLPREAEWLPVFDF